MLIKIDKEGNLTYIYKDSHPALKLGKPTINRFSDVRYDNTLQLWFVYEYDPLNPYIPKNYNSVLEKDKLLIDQGFSSREKAIESEINFIEKGLISGEI